MAMRLLDQNAGDLGLVLGLSRQAGQQRQTGGARLRIEDIETICGAWNLPLDLFRMEPLDAGSWILNNMSEQVIQALRWNTAPQDNGLDLLVKVPV